MGKDAKEKKPLEPVTRDYTVNLHKRLQKIAFKRRAPRAIKELVKFAQTNMFTQVHTKLSILFFLISTSTLTLHPLNLICL